MARWVMSKRLILSFVGAVFMSAVTASAAPAHRDDPASPPVPRQELTDEENYELLRLLADTLDQVERNYVQEVTRRDLIEAAIKGVVAKLDPYSDYIEPEELDRFRSGVENEFGGIGIQVAIENGQLVITSPIVGTPAYRAGILAGDAITKIEGSSTKGITLDDAIRKLKGKAGTSVTFTVRHAHNKEEETVTIAREIIHVDSVLGDLRNDDDSWNWYIDPEKKIGYIRITSFSRRTAADLKTALKQLVDSGMKGLIIDLRFNPGGLLTSAIEISDIFVSDGLIVSTKGRNTPENKRFAKKDGTFEGFPIAVLVNRYSASASEILSACLQDHARAVVIGERTWGKGSVQNIINLEEGKSALKLTTASYHRPNGKNIHKFEGATDADEWGVKPNDGYTMMLSDKEMSDLLEYRRLRDVVKGKPDSAEFTDKQLAKAKEYILGEIGAAIPVAVTPREDKPSPPVPPTGE